MKTMSLEWSRAVVQTPLLADGNFDPVGQARLINFLNKKKVNGFWGLGTGSEDMNLTFAKRKAAAETICKANAGVAPLVLGCGFFCLEDTMNFIEEIQHHEFDAYHYMPYHPLISRERIAYIYKRIVDFSEAAMYTSANWAQPITPNL